MVLQQFVYSCTFSHCVHDRLYAELYLFSETAYAVVSVEGSSSMPNSLL
jgi:hypothetical protein